MRKMLRMKLLMIVGTADDIFVHNMAKWLKRYMDIDIDIIEYNDSNKRQRVYNYDYYDRIDTMPQGYLFSKVPFVNRFTLDWCRCHQLKEMLKGRYYDIIHCHYILGLYAGADFLKKHCDRLYFSFWGGELATGKYLGSNRLYKNRLNRIIYYYVDGIVNSLSSGKPFVKNGKEPRCYRGDFGSGPLEAIYECLDKNGREECKEYWGIPLDKFSVQLGYSGKEIHQYIEIIKELILHDDLKDKLHLVAPMTRGSKSSYTEKVKNTLKDTGYSYSIIERHLSDVEMAKYRCSIDIVLQLTIYDGLSRSIVEALSAGSVLIYGDWLNYKVKFQRDGFEGIEVDSIKSGVDKIRYVIDNWSLCQKLCGENIKRGKSKYVWSECIKEWVAVYEGTAIPLN